MEECEHNRVVTWWTFGGYWAQCTGCRKTVNPMTIGEATRDRTREAALSALIGREGIWRSGGRPPVGWLNDGMEYWVLD